MPGRGVLNMEVKNLILEAGTASGTAHKNYG
jgi:hypothetical protein